MIWIASFPRSGNTFLRNILFEVYGLESSTYHIDPNHFKDEHFQTYPFVKTHLLPNQLPFKEKNIASIYLIRDGRDVMCSLAHHKKDIISPGTDFISNLQEAIIAEKGSYFGGYSENVNQWIEKADIIIRYEDLVKNPRLTVEKINDIYPLPKAKWENMPSFDQMKNRVNQYGSGIQYGIKNKQKLDLSRKNFRKGKIGNWKEEMPEEFQELFWSFHGETMQKLGYSRNGNIELPDSELNHELLLKLGHKLKIPAKKKSVLIESNKLISTDNDGIKRYQVGLLKAMWPMAKNPYSNWDVSLLINGNILALKSCGHLIFSDFNRKAISSIKSNLKANKKTIQNLSINANSQKKSITKQDDSSTVIYGAKEKSIFKKTRFERFEQTILNAIPAKFKDFLYKNNIWVLHRIYDAFRPINQFFIDKLPKAFSNLISYAVNFIKSGLKKPQFKKKQKFDLIHLPIKQHYKEIRQKSKNYVVTLHDLTHKYYSRFHTPINVENAKKGIDFIRKKKAGIIAVSKSTCLDAEKELGSEGLKLFHIYESADPAKFYYSINHSDNIKTLEKYHIDTDKPYLLCLSTIEPRKNLVNTIRAFQLLLSNHPDYSLNLVIVGKKGWMWEDVFKEYELSDSRVIFTGFVDDRDLAAIYTEALALCYVSYYEGFGLPALEAMKCKTPVIYGNNSSLPEVVALGGLPANPEDVNDIAAQMNKIFTDHELREKLRLEALKQSNSFSWYQTALKTLKAYEAIIN